MSQKETPLSRGFRPTNFTSELPGVQADIGQSIPRFAAAEIVAVEIVIRASGQVLCLATRTAVRRGNGLTVPAVFVPAELLL